jgi:hypothetical protein
LGHSAPGKILRHPIPKQRILSRPCYDEGKGTAGTISLKYGKKESSTRKNRKGYRKKGKKEAHYSFEYEKSSN